MQSCEMANMGLEVVQLLTKPLFSILNSYVVSESFFLHVEYTELLVRRVIGNTRCDKIYPMMSLVVVNATADVCRTLKTNHVNDIISNLLISVGLHFIGSCCNKTEGRLEGHADVV